MKKQEIVIERPDLKTMRVKVKSLSPLMSNPWTIKATKQMEDKQAGKPKTRKREPRNPEQEYKDRLQKNGKGYIFNSAPFRLSAVAACRHVEGIAMTQARSFFFIPEDHVIIKGDPVMDSRPVRLESGVASMAYRPRWDEWETEFSVRYNAGAISAEQVLNLIAIAGEMVGVGEYRVERGGTYGRFEIV